MCDQNESFQKVNDFNEKPLSFVEKAFLLHAERGDCATVRRIIEEYWNDPKQFDINCVDALGRSALVAAIENENIELVKILLEYNIDLKDSLLHAIKEEFVEAVELLLDWEEKSHQPGKPYSWERVDQTYTMFTDDMTPLILAAHKNNYEIMKMLLDRGATLPVPHDIKCGCDVCVFSVKTDSLRHSQSRINAYKALTSPSLISLSSPDPLLTAFELSGDLRRLSRMETEFVAEYNLINSLFPVQLNSNLSLFNALSDFFKRPRAKYASQAMRQEVEEFATSLLDHVRTSSELMIMLNYDHKNPTWVTGERQTLERLKLAIKHKQKKFVAHPNVQQLLAAIWYEGLPGFRRKNNLAQAIQVIKYGLLFPFYGLFYMMAPMSKKGKFMKKPFVKFICHSSSYIFFLGAASQKIDIMLMELSGSEHMKNFAEEWKKKERGASLTFIEYGVIFYLASFMWSRIKILWSRGIKEHFSNMWNILDFLADSFYILWLALRLTSYYSTRDMEAKGGYPWYPREQWHSFEPMLISEGAFATALILSFLKLVHIFNVNPHLGPLQISLSRMVIDIIKFFFIYTLVLFAFGCGLNQLLWYYAELEKNKCYHTEDGSPDFQNHDKACTVWRRYANLFETSQTLFWAGFGLIDLMTFELTGIKAFTRFWALTIFGSYAVINVIVLLNMLIAMMSSSFQIIWERADTEWKFARSRLWISYFDDNNVLPPPFNILPDFELVRRLFGGRKRQTGSFRQESKQKAKEKHDTVMRMLVRRYVIAEQRKRDKFGITEDDVMEIRQDISMLRYEIIDTLKSNGMKTPKVSVEDNQVCGKRGKVVERRILKDFQIGVVINLDEDGKKNKQKKGFLGHVSKVITRRSPQMKRIYWNNVAKSSKKCDPIGSKQRVGNLRQRKLGMSFVDDLPSKKECNGDVKIDLGAQ